jgi:hypothetical protein
VILAIDDGKKLMVNFLNLAGAGVALAPPEYLLLLFLHPVN